MGEGSTMTRNPVLLTEYVRQSLRRAIVKPYLNVAGKTFPHILSSRNGSGSRGCRRTWRA